MFTDCYCTQFRRTSAALTRIYDEALRPAGLRITQFSLLRSLGRLGLSTTTQLAEEAALDRTTISRNMKILVDAGWVDVTEGVHDKRERLLSLNKAGQKAISDALPFFQKAQQIVERSSESAMARRSNDKLFHALLDLQAENQGASEMADAACAG